MDGIRNKILPPQSVEENIALLSEAELTQRGVEPLPINLLEAVTEMKKDPFIRQVLGDHVTDKFIAAKEEEWKEYSTQVSQWEIDQYLARI